MDDVAVDKLNGPDSLAVDALESLAHHVQHVAVCHEADPAARYVCTRLGLGMG